MSVYAGPEIVNNGLILNLDAANIKCYSGTGTSWNNPIGIYSGSLINGTTYVNDPSRFDTNATLATTQNYLSVSPLIEFLDSSTYSLSFWVKLRSNASATFHSLMGRNLTSPWLSVYSNNTLKTDWYIRYRQTGGTYYNFTAITDYNLQSNWANICLTIDSSRNVKFYLNSVFKETVIPTTTLFGVNVLAGGYSSSGNYYPFQGSMAIALFYNITLSESEIQQNFNANKSRFGL